MLDTVFVASRVVLPAGVRPACVGVADGRVVTLTAPGRLPEARRTVRLADDEVLLPGLVDSHVHLQNPGHPEWEDLASATRAALLAGVTTLVDMPVDSEPVTIDVASVAAKRSAMNGRVFTDVGLWAGNQALLQQVHHSRRDATFPAASAWPINAADPALTVSPRGPLIRPGAGGAVTGGAAVRGDVDRLSFTLAFVEEAGVEPRG